MGNYYTFSMAQADFSNNKEIMYREQMQLGRMAKSVRAFMGLISRHSAQRGGNLGFGQRLSNREGNFRRPELNNLFITRMRIF